MLFPRRQKSTINRCRSFYWSNWVKFPNRPSLRRQNPVWQKRLPQRARARQKKRREQRRKPYVRSNWADLIPPFGTLQRWWEEITATIMHRTEEPIPLLNRGGHQGRSILPSIAPKSGRRLCVMALFRLAAALPIRKRRDGIWH